MLENQKLVNLLLKIENKIDNFLRSSNVNSDLAKDVKKLIQKNIDIVSASK